MKALFFAAVVSVLFSFSAVAEPFEKDIITTGNGDIEITFIGHGTLMISYQGKVIHIDPYGKLADYSKLPKADFIFITHGHGDHLDKEALNLIRTERTIVILTKICSETVEGIVMKNGDTHNIMGIGVEAVPAYNLTHKRPNGDVFHPKGEGNGYVLTFGDRRIYIAGDTENIPEMKDLKNIDVAFIPMNLPYTMTPEMAKDAAGMFSPKILYPYHYGETDPKLLVDLLKDNKEIEVRVRKMM